METAKDQETQLLQISHQINLKISLQSYRNVRNVVSLKTLLSAIGAPNDSTELVIIQQKLNWLCCTQPHVFAAFVCLHFLMF